MITDADDYFTKGCGRCAKFNTDNCAALRWADGLSDLREMCKSAGLAETAKWGHPCYTHAGRNIVILGAFQADFRISFFNAPLKKDPDGLLERSGPNTQNPDMIRFAENTGPMRYSEQITAYLKEAMSYAALGLKPEKDASTLILPDELVTALDADPVLAEAFHALTRGRQKSYVINLNGAKKVETKIARIAKFRDKIIAGKGALER